MLYLKQSTASQSVLIGPFVDDTDGTTAETGLSIANTDIRLSKNGGNLAAKNSGGGTHDEAGWYQITLDATDTDTLGRLQVHCKMTGALMVHSEFHVLAANVYDSLIGSGDVLQVDVTQVGGSSQDLPTATALATAQSDLDTITGSDGVTLATTQGNYAPATVAALATVDGNVDTLIGRVPGNITITDGRVVADTTAISGNGTAADNLESFALGNSLATLPKIDVQQINGGATAADDLRTAIEAGLSTLTAAAVNAEMVDVLATDTYAESSGVPAATASLAAKIQWLATLARNKMTQTATTTVLRNDADSGNVATSTVSDDGTTFTRGEWS